MWKTKEVQKDGGRVRCAPTSPTFRSPKSSCLLRWRDIGMLSSHLFALFLLVFRTAQGMPVPAGEPPTQTDPTLTHPPSSSRTHTGVRPGRFNVPIDVAEREDLIEKLQKHKHHDENEINTLRDIGAKCAQLFCNNPAVLAKVPISRATGKHDEYTHEHLPPLITSIPQWSLTRGLEPKRIDN